MIWDDDAVQRDEDYHVIDEPPTPEAPAREPRDYRVVREQLLELVPSTPRFQVYWTVPLDIEWAD